MKNKNKLVCQTFFQNNFCFIREAASPEKRLQKLFEVKLKLCQRGPKNHLLAAAYVSLILLPLHIALFKHQQSHHPPWHLQT